MKSSVNILSVLDYDFTYPLVFWGIIPLVLILVGIKFLANKKKTERLSLSTAGKYNLKSHAFTTYQWILHGLTILGFILVLTAIASPKDPKKREVLEDNYIEGIDIIIAMDISASMNAEDFNKNRLDASIRMAQEFVDKRENDNIGLVVYGGEAFMVSPLSHDHNHLKEKFAELNTNMVTASTAIGDGLNLAAASIYKSKAKSKVIILLTDGVNNTGEIDPLTAAENAKSYDIKVYTIGIGSNGTAPMPIDMGGYTIRQSVPVEIDEELLQEIAKETGGNYYRATNEAALAAIYDEINELEKSKIKSNAITIEPPEEFRWYLIPGLLLLLIPTILNFTILRHLP